MIGTNPLSFAVPGRSGKIAFLIDQSASAVTWTAVKLAADEGRSIPLGWALDAEGKPTTDPARGLAGSMAPAGGYKGFGQGLIVEVMCAALAGANRGPQMGSFMANDGKPIGCGQFFIALEPKAFSGGRFAKEAKALAKSILGQEGTRLPNARREANQKRLVKEGLLIDRALYERLKSFAERRLSLEIRNLAPLGDATSDKSVDLFGDCRIEVRFAIFGERLFPQRVGLLRGLR